jgi:geranylgeranyl diphosphate synthase type II
MIDFTRYQEMTEKHLMNFVNSEINSSKLRNNTLFLTTLHEPVEYIISGGGKRIRPVLLMLSAEAFGASPENVLDAAVAVELLHNFTLVHDDIMDNAYLRRGRSTVHNRYDVNTAILVGDELIALSYRSLLKLHTERISEVLKTFTDGVIEVCEGQSIDKAFESVDTVFLSDYILMIKKKTAELLKASSLIGAIAGGAEGEELMIISDYSENLGIAFQIQDDLLDATADETELGKKTGSDITEKKKTFLYVKTTELLSGKDKDDFISLYHSDSPDKIRKVIGLYHDLCVIQSTAEEVRKYTERAKKSLAGLNNQNARRSLEAFSQMLLNRNF